MGEGLLDIEVRLSFDRDNRAGLQCGVAVIGRWRVTASDVINR